MPRSCIFSAPSGVVTQTRADDAAAGETAANRNPTARTIARTSTPSRGRALPGSEFVQTRKSLRASTVVSRARVREDRQRDLRRRLDRPLARGRHRHPVHRRARAAAARGRGSAWRGSCSAGALSVAVVMVGFGAAASRSTTTRLPWALGARRRLGVARAVPVAARARLRLSRRPAAVAALAADGARSRSRRRAGALLLLPLQPTLEGPYGDVAEPDRRRRSASRTC